MVINNEIRDDGEVKTGSGRVTETEWDQQAGRQTA